MDPPDETVAPALERLQENIELLSIATDALERMLRRAESLEDSKVREIVPFLGLLWLYLSAMRDVLHAKRQDGSVLWNAPALAVLCRPLVDAFLSFFYFAIERPPGDEAEFRQLMLSRHFAYKRWDLLRRADQSNKEIATECEAAKATWEAVNQTMLTHAYFAKLDPVAAKKLTNDGERYYLEPLHAVWGRAGLPEELYGVTFRHLSQYAHATPYAIASLRFHSAGKESGAVNMSVPVGLALACVMKALQFCGDLHTELEELGSSTMAKFLQHKAAQP